MPRKKAATATKTKSTKRKPVAEKVVTEVPQKQSSFAQYLRFGESYTSLVLGIIVVIIATVLLLSFVHNRQAEIPQENQEQLSLTEGQIDEGAVATTSASVTPTATSIPTATTVPTATSVPTMTTVPTKTVQATSTPKPTATATSAPTKAPAIEKQPVGGGKTYTVMAGDTLWKIAEKTYKSGYNWVDIARANKLTDPNDIHVGNRLILPQVKSKTATVNGNGTKGEEKATTVMVDKKITGNTYKIAHGDTLWDIAVRAYGDGYAWTKIADANKLKENPGLIHVGNTIKIPRK